MALELTKQVEAVVRARQLFEQFEHRLSNYGALDAYRSGGEQLLPKATVEAIKNAQNVRAISFPMFQKQALSIITSNVCTFTGVEPNSVKPQFSSIYRSFSIKVHPKVCADNMLSEEEAFAQGLYNGLKSMAANLDTYAAGQLEANKSAGLVAPTGIAGAAIVANAYQINLANRNNLYAYIPTLMALNDIDSSNLINAMSTTGKVLMAQYETNGVNNSQNLAGLLNGTLPSASGYRHFSSNRIGNSAGVSETHYLSPFGSLGMFTYLDSSVRQGIVHGVNGKKIYALTDQILGLDWAVTEEPICEDLSGTYGAGFERCEGTQYNFGSYFSFMNAYSSDTTRPIYKVEVLTT